MLLMSGFRLSGEKYPETREKKLSGKIEESKELLENAQRRVNDIAADLNNVLTIILGYASLLRMEDIPEDMDIVLSRIETACKRAATLTQKLFSAVETRNVKDP